jgi:aminopeptidase N
VPGENLTRIEAQGRKAIVDVASYEVVLDLTTGDKTFASTTTVIFSAMPGSSTFIDAITAKVHSVTLNGTPLDPAAVSDGVRIQLDNLAAENVLVVVADAAYTNTGEGLHRFVDPVDGEVYLYSQFEVPDSRRVFAVFEQPDLKATFQFTVTAPAEWEVVSNQPAPSPTAGPSTSSVSASMVWAFPATPIVSSYVTALIAGPYAVVRDSLTSRDGRTIPLGIYSRKSLTEFVDSDYIFDITRKGFEFYEDKFDYAYPFDKYDQLFVPEFNAGAMENAGAITFTEAYVFRSKVTDAIKERRVITILHELAHMWFGDLVTMKWWNDLWLNESFAEWASAQASADVTEWTEAWTTFAMMEKSAAYRQDQLPSTHPVVATINDLEDVQVNFDHITYAKGGSVLKQLVAWVGIDAFYAGVAAYFKKHKYGNTELGDLLAELETTSGRELTEWSKVWLETAGVNTLRPDIETDADGVITRFDILQTAEKDYPTIRPHRLAVGLYDLVGGKLVRIKRVELDVAGESTPVTELIGERKPALVLLNDDDLAYAKIRLDDESLAVAMEHLSDIENALARALVWGAAWDAMRDGETKASDYVDLVLGNIASESESTTIRVTLTQLLTAARFYVAPAKRNAVIEKVGDALWALAQGAKAGSDEQFQFVKFFAAIPSTPAHVAALKALRDGTSSLKGLEIDADLDWELLEGLVLGGAAGQPEIDAALAKDNTANGQQSAARATATIPTAAAKKAAFDSLVTKDDQSNVIVRSVGVGYTHTNDPASLAGQVTPYFDAISDIWKSRSYKIAEYIVFGLYPTPLVSVELVDATKAWLAANPEIPALRRLVTENLAGVERALLAQAKDA